LGVAAADACNSPLGVGGTGGGAGGGTGGGAGSGTGGLADGGTGGAADGATCSHAYDPNVTRVLGRPCLHDADCGNAYLTCVPQAGQVTGNLLCALRYQQACQVDKDCGPAGFTCVDRICSEEPSYPCTCDEQCPQGWSCTDPCATGDTANWSCYPPMGPLVCPA
jgi:hypothetical protein